MSTETILIVDDNREIVDSLGKLLALEGYDIITAYDGMEALEQLEKNKIDLILLDVMMPRLNGLSALMKIRESYKIPAIILSAKTEESDKVSGLVLGADDYVSKPYNAAELIARVKRSFADITPGEGLSGIRKGQDHNGGLVLDKKTAHSHSRRERDQAYCYRV